MSADDKKQGEEKSGGNYPYCPLNQCLEIAEAVKALGGGKSPVSKAILASHLKEEESSQVLSFKLAATKSFGLISGRAHYSLTELSRRYFFPTGLSDRKNALLDALEYAPAFKMLVERFDGNKLPQLDILSNILHRDGSVPESWKDRAAGIFTKSASIAGALDKEGCLRVKALRDLQAARQVTLTEMISTLKDAGENQAVKQPSPPREGDEIEKSAKDESMHTYILPLPNKRRVIVVAPLDINKTEILRLQKWIEFTLVLDWKDETGT